MQIDDGTVLTLLQHLDVYGFWRNAVIVPIVPDYSVVVHDHQLTRKNLGIKNPEDLTSSAPGAVRPRVSKPRHAQILYRMAGDSCESFVSLAEIGASLLVLIATMGVGMSAYRMTICKDPCD